MGDFRAEYHIDDRTFIGKSNHPGHKSELEIRTENGIIRLNFTSEKALDRFYQVLQPFYRRVKKFYETRRERDDTVVPAVGDDVQ